MSGYSVTAAACLVARASDRPKATAALQAAGLLSLSLGLGLRTRVLPGPALAALSAALLATLQPLLAMNFDLGENGPRQASLGGGGGAEESLGGFVCPGMPVVPWLALCCNAGLVAQLHWHAWARLATLTTLFLARDAWLNDERRKETPALPLGGEKPDIPHLFACPEGGKEVSPRGEERELLLAEENQGTARPMSP